MIKICVLIAFLYRKYWPWLGSISALLTLIKIGDLVVPLLAGKVLESIGKDAAARQTLLWLAVAVAVWMVHGNVLPWLFNSIDAKKVELYARRDVSLWSLNRAKTYAAAHDTAMLQTIIERGETVIPDFMASLTRVLLPSIIPCVAVIIALITISPTLFLALAIGCGLYAAITLHMNRLLMPQYADLQEVDNRREQMRIKIFRVLAKPASPIHDMIEAYGQRYTKVATAGSQIRACYLNFDLSRGIVINVMNAGTWIVGIHAVRTNQFGLAVFIAFISWSTACISYVQVATAIHKQWLETGPALRNYFSVVNGIEPDLPATAGGVPEVFQPAE